MENNMRFEIQGKQYSVRFIHDKIGWTTCSIMELVGEEAVPRVYISHGEWKGRKKLNRPELIKLLLSKAIRLLVPPTEPTVWEKKDIVIPSKIKKLGANVIEKYVAYQLEKLKLITPRMQRSFEDTLNRWYFWSAFSKKYTRAIKKISPLPNKKEL